ncbi:MAG TPA: hypothetical protein VGP63_13175 [Planctomycetaceae bacterium]|jgi:hypothetical protein|nr:hypothetical protein [Planctomycetaceae bacterium]
MSDSEFAAIDEIHRSQGPAAAVNELVRTLEASHDWHRVFDALLLKKKLEMGLPTARPASFDQVPENRQAEFEESYVEAARRVGRALLAENNIPQAWMYLRTVREPQVVAEALDRVDSQNELPENVDDLISVALYERAHPVKGLELMLKSRGTCNTISAFDQAIGQLSSDERLHGAELLVKHLYDELLQSVRRDLERRQSEQNSAEAGAGTEAELPAPAALIEAIAGREWLFAEGNYHIDVSHLGSVVRFARFLTPESPSLGKATELCEYGRQLSSQFQYPSDPPFDDYYIAHLHFFKVLQNSDRQKSLDYFRDRLSAAVETDDRRLIAYVLVDLLVRTGALEDAVLVAAEHLRDLDESSGFSFAQLCEEAGRLDLFRDAAREKGDLIGFTSALVGHPAVSQTPKATAKG